MVNGREQRHLDQIGTGFLELYFRKDGVPVLFHVDDDPAVGRRVVEHFVEGADVTLAVVGILALGIGVVHEACGIGTGYLSGYLSKRGIWTRATIDPGP